MSTAPIIAKNYAHNHTKFSMHNSNEQIHLQSIIPIELTGKRLDQVLHILFPEYSRSRLQEWIKQNVVKLDGLIASNQKIKIKSGQIITIDALQEIHAQAKPQNIPLNIIYEDDTIIVINKQVGLVVHPGAGISDSTLMNALLHHAPELKTIPRAGIIHRLDKDTSGLLVIAKTLTAHTKLVAELQERKIKREYEAVVYGAMITGGTVAASIGRHPLKRTSMAVREEGKEAITHYRVLERFRDYTYIKVNLETGRTHQIRVHMVHIGHPIVGDQLYGGRFKLPKNASIELISFLKKFNHQALHARRLGLVHPKTGKFIEFVAELPEDFLFLLKLLREDNE